MREEAARLGFEINIIGPGYGGIEVSGHANGASLPSSTSGGRAARCGSADNMVAMVQASAALPVMLFSITADAIADNLNRRRA
jgi:hypothetical protein